MYKTALTLYRPTGCGKVLATPGPTGCGMRMQVLATPGPRMQVPVSLYHEFLDVCRSDNLDQIRAFHAERIMQSPDIRLYSTFMGTVYGTLKEQKMDDQILRWFQMIAAEIHRLH